MRLTLTALCAILTALPAWAENRGVVVANRDYAHAPALPQADAAPAMDALRAAGFRAFGGQDLAAADLRAAMGDLLSPDETPGARLVLLSGHFLSRTGDSWFLGADADRPDAFGIGAAGVSLVTVMDLMTTGEPGAVLVLGSDNGAMPHGAGLNDGIGALVAPEGVTLLRGDPVTASAAAAALLRPGASVQDVLDAHDGLSMAEGGDAGLVLVAQSATDMPDPARPSNNLLAPDREAWAAAAAADTIESYRSYLDRYPNGLYSAAAGARLAQLGDSQQSAASDRDAWAEAAAVNSPEAYRSYLSRFPQGTYADAANRRLAEIAAARQPATPIPAPAPTPAPTPAPARPAPAKPAPSPAPSAPAGYAEEQRLGLGRDDRMQVQRFLNTMGYATGGVDGVMGSRSRQAIRSWQQANGYGATGFLTGNQLADLRGQANARKDAQRSNDQAYWEQTGGRGGAANLRAYLNRYPNGIHAERARAQLRNLNNDDGRVIRGDRDDRAFAQARNQNTIRAYDSYLKNWPNGKYVRQARENREVLRRRQNRREDEVLSLDPETIIREFLK